MTRLSTSADNSGHHRRAHDLARVVTGTDLDRVSHRVLGPVAVRTDALIDQFGAEAVAAWLAELAADGWTTLGPSDLTRLAGRGAITPHVRPPGGPCAA